MFLFKYGRFIYNFVNFDGYLLDPKIKLKGREKWSFFQDFSPLFAQASNQLAWASEYI